MSESLYFIAIVIPEPLQGEITRLKMDVAEKFGSSHALKSPAHITLHMPFKWKDKKIDALQKVMKQINQDLQLFTVELDGFGFFEPRVVFVDVSENETLNTLQKKVVDLCRKELKLDNANYRNKPFHPHVTIGFRDLRKRMFFEAKKFYSQKQISASLVVERVDLLKHDGKKWHLHIL